MSIIMKKATLILLSLMIYSSSFSQQKDSTFIKFVAKNFIVPNCLKNTCEVSIISIRLKETNNNKIEFDMIDNLNSEIAQSLKFIANFKTKDNNIELDNTILFILVENNKDECLSDRNSNAVSGKEILEIIVKEQKLNPKVKILSPVIAKINSTYN